MVSEVEKSTRNRTEKGNGSELGNEGHEIVIRLYEHWSPLSFLTSVSSVFFLGGSGQFWFFWVCGWAYLLAQHFF